MSYKQSAMYVLPCQTIPGGATIDKSTIPGGANLLLKIGLFKYVIIAAKNGLVCHYFAKIVPPRMVWLIISAPRNGLACQMSLVPVINGLVCYQCCQE